MILSMIKIGSYFILFMHSTLLSYIVKFSLTFLKYGFLIKKIVFALDDRKPKQEIKSDADSAKEDSVDEDDQKLVIKEEPESQFDEPETNNLSQASSCDYNLSQFKDEPPFSADEDSERNEDSESQEEEKSKYKQEPEDSEEDIPLVGVAFLY